MDSQQIIDRISSLLEQIFEYSQIDAKLDITETEKIDRPHFNVDIVTDDASLLIGYHGETLNSLQHYIASNLYRNFDDDFTVLLDIAGYREERDEKLRSMAANAAEKSIALGKPVGLAAMNSYERKMIHERVGEIDGVNSYSEGEGRDRRVIISPVENS